MANRLVKVTDAATGELKRWETPKGKTVAVNENGSLVLTKPGKKLGYGVNGLTVVAFSGLSHFMEKHRN